MPVPGVSLFLQERLGYIDREQRTVMKSDAQPRKTTSVDMTAGPIMKQIVFLRFR